MLNADVSAAHDRLEDYHRRFLQAEAALPERDPTSPADREAITGIVRASLGIRAAWIPRIAAEVVQTDPGEGFVVQRLAATSWPGVRATALLYLPQGAEISETRAQWPFVLLCCGHGQGGKLAPGYQRMARHLARCGAIVLCPDNIGQGERVAMGHGEVVAPFAVGLSLQGLIVMETLGWLDWARRDARVDPRRLAAIGNSGGGLLTLLLIPFAPDLAALVSSGYPSCFHFIARKEKKHCHCNILPGFARQLEMSQIYGCFAPRPMLLFQGEGDPLFPPDLFLRTARRVRRSYEQLDAGEQFSAAVTPGAHSWDQERIERVGTFLARHLGLRAASPRPDEPVLPPEATCFNPWPGDALGADAIACQLTGKSAAPDLKLWDVFRPVPLPPTPLATVTERGDFRQILAQFEAFLTGHPGEDRAAGID